MLIYRGQGQISDIPVAIEYSISMSLCIIVIILLRAQMLNYSDNGSQHKF